MENLLRIDLTAQPLNIKTLQAALEQASTDPHLQLPTLLMQAKQAGLSVLTLSVEPYQAFLLQSLGRLIGDKQIAAASGTIHFILDPNLYFQIVNSPAAGRMSLQKLLVDKLIGGRYSFFSMEPEVTDGVFNKGWQLSRKLVGDLIKLVKQGSEAAIKADSTLSRQQAYNLNYQNNVGNAFIAAVQEAFGEDGTMNMRDILSDVSAQMFNQLVFAHQLTSPAVKAMLAEKYNITEDPLKVLSDLHHQLKAPTAGRLVNNKPLKIVQDILRTVLEDTRAKLAEVTADPEVQAANLSQLHPQYQLLEELLTKPDEEYAQILRQNGVRNPTKADAMMFMISTLNLLILAGKDTVATQAEWIVYLLFHRTNAEGINFLNVLKEQVRQHIAALPEGTPVDVATIANLPCIQAWVEEVLRLASVPGILTKRFTADVTLQDSQGGLAQFHAGDNAVCPPVIVESGPIQLNGQVFNVDWQEIRLDRHYDENGNFVLGDNKTRPYNAAFGGMPGGRTACPGAPLARLNLAAITAALVLHVDIVDNLSDTQGTYQAGKCFIGIENIIPREIQEYKVKLGQL